MTNGLFRFLFLFLGIIERKLLRGRSTDARVMSYQDRIRRIPPHAEWPKGPQAPLLRRDPLPRCAQARPASLANRAALTASLADPCPFNPDRPPTSINASTNPLPSCVIRDSGLRAPSG